MLIDRLLKLASPFWAVTVSVPESVPPPGLAPRPIVTASLLSVVTLLGIQVGTILSGAIIVETVFAWPGMGRLSIQSIQAADFPVVQTAVIVTSIWIVTATSPIKACGSSASKDHPGAEPEGSLNCGDPSA